MAEAKHRCTLREFRQWQRFAELEPFGEMRQDLRAGVIAQTVAAAAGNKRAKLKDFLVFELMEKSAKQSNATMAANFRLFAAKHNARLK